MKNFRVLLTLSVALLSLAACRYDMQDQPKYEPFEGSEIFSDSIAGRMPLQGTVARGFLQEDAHLYQGKQMATPVASGSTAAGSAAAGSAAVPGTPNMSGFANTFPFPITQAMVDRGEERYNIYCAPCHGKTGAGDGMIARRGFRPPPSYHIDRLRTAPVGYYFDVITNGFGVMPDYAQQISASDRWAIVAYIRALQLSMNAKSTDLTAEDVQKLNAPPAPKAAPSSHGGGHGH